MTIDKVTIHVSKETGKGKEYEIELTLTQLMELLEYRTNAIGEISPNGNYPKGLWIFIEAYVKTTDELTKKFNQ